MKLLSLLVFVFAGSISLFAASEEPELDMSPQVSGAPVFKIGSLSLNPTGNVKSTFAWPSSQGRHLVPEKSGESATCFTMRAYFVIRDSRNPDVTRPDGYSTCQPATRFQVKRAIEKGMEQRMIEDGPTEPENIPPN